MNCTVLSDQKINLKVIWKRENVDINPDGVKFVIDPNHHHLTIRNVSLNDSGRTNICFRLVATSVFFFTA